MLDRREAGDRCSTASASGRCCRSTAASRRRSIVETERPAADLAFLSAHDDDPFARYEAMQQLMLDTLLAAIGRRRADHGPVIEAVRQHADRRGARSGLHRRGGAAAERGLHRRPYGAGRSRGDPHRPRGASRRARAGARAAVARRLCRDRPPTATNISRPPRARGGCAPSRSAISWRPGPRTRRRWRCASLTRPTT